LWSLVNGPIYKKLRSWGIQEINLSILILFVFDQTHRMMRQGRSQNMGHPLGESRKKQHFNIFYKIKSLAI
jgi:hypothetical protein